MLINKENFISTFVTNRMIVKIDFPKYLSPSLGIKNPLNSTLTGKTMKNFYVPISMMVKPV